MELAFELDELGPRDIVFAILSECRSTPIATVRALRRALGKRGLRPRPTLAFWVSLLGQAHLLQRSSCWRPTPRVLPWFQRTEDQQIRDLLLAWTKTPIRARLRRHRCRLVDVLKRAVRQGSSSLPARRWSPADIQALEALGIIRAGDFTASGVRILADTAEIDALPPQPWTCSGGLLRTDPDRLDLRWQLEAFLKPITERLYVLTPTALQVTLQSWWTAHPHQPHPLIELLEAALAPRTVPDKIRATLAGSPILRVLPGVVLEFATAEDLVRVRDLMTPSRGDTAGMLSARHLHIAPPRADQALRGLERRGLLLARQEPPRQAKHPPDQASATSGKGWRPADGERAALLAAVLLIEQLAPRWAVAPELVQRLRRGLPTTLTNAAERQVLLALPDTGRLRAANAARPGITAPPFPQGDLEGTLRAAIAMHETLDVHYWAPGREAAELRRLAPISLEQRHGRHYLIAYCHTRRANRTFRLDRLLLAYPKPHPSVAAPVNE